MINPNSIMPFEETSLVADALNSMSASTFFIILGAIILLSIEFVYFKLIKKVKRGKKENLWLFSASMKFLSLLLSITIACSVILIPFLIEALVFCIFYVVINLIWYWQPICIGLGIAAILFIYLWINKKVLEKHGAVRTAKEEKEIIARENKGRRFKIGDKVRVKKWPFRTNCPGKKELCGKVFTVRKHRNYSCGLECFKLDDGMHWHWCEDQVTKVKKQSKAQKKNKAQKQLKAQKKNKSKKK